MADYTPPYPNAATDPFNQVLGMNQPKKKAVTTAKKETSGWEYDKFCEWAFQRTFNGLVTGGLKGMKDAITYEVVQECARLMRQGGFKEKAHG